MSLLTVKLGFVELRAGGGSGHFELTNKSALLFLPLLLVHLQSCFPTVIVCVVLVFVCKGVFFGGGWGGVLYVKS